MNWLDRRKEKVKFENDEATVLVIGGGQNGCQYLLTPHLAVSDRAILVEIEIRKKMTADVLDAFTVMLAARLGALGISTLIVEKNKRVGDSWRNVSLFYIFLAILSSSNIPPYFLCPPTTMSDALRRPQRYHSLALHDPIYADHFPYLPYPPHFPTYIPKDKLADFMESYASVRPSDLPSLFSDADLDAVVDYGIECMAQLDDRAQSSIRRIDWALVGQSHQGWCHPKYASRSSRQFDFSLS